LGTKASLDTEGAFESDRCSRSHRRFWSNYYCHESFPNMKNQRAIEEIKRENALIVEILNQGNNAEALTARLEALFKAGLLPKYGESLHKNWRDVSKKGNGPGGDRP
jgi:hypothetical protein